MSTTVRAVRGATTLDLDDGDHLAERVIAMLGEIVERNEIDVADLVSVMFSSTADVTAAVPAEAARRFGLVHVPLLCFREHEVVGSMPLCIRALVHVNSDKSLEEIRHVYLERAAALRPDLAD